MRAQPIIEIYRNTIHVSKSYRLIHLRGGSVLIHDNSMITDVGSTPIITLNEEEDWQTSMFNPLRTTWPAEDQVAASFFWNNTLNGAMASSGDVIPWNGAPDATFIQEGRDFWMKAPDASTCTSYPQVVNYPSSAQSYPMPDSTHGFACIGSYTPYAYPHPLTLN
jgi:hypothetical protein